MARRQVVVCSQQPVVWQRTNDKGSSWKRSATVASAGLSSEWKSEEQRRADRGVGAVLLGGAGRFFRGEAGGAHLGKGGAG